MRGHNVLEPEHLANFIVLNMIWICFYHAFALTFVFVAAKNCSIYPVNHLIQFFFTFIQNLLAFLLGFILRLPFIFEIMGLLHIGKQSTCLDLVALFRRFQIIMVQIEGDSQAVTVDVASIVLVDIPE